ncbi:restriction endonuclease [Mycoplasma amphoriforme]|uniref:Uncharacterized protein n=1 Tax=Mycoplasma amphoriforme A39 TaxID=572419 RepID=A0A292IJ57_9MOLU|nr:unnamed protein product [Mycoplasma amphoriforme A39]
MFNRDYVDKCNINVIDSQGKIYTSKRYLLDSDLNLEIFVVYDIFVDILKKINIRVEDKNLKFLSTIVSSSNPYGIRSEAIKNPNKFGLPNFSSKKIVNGYEILGIDASKNRCLMYLPKNYPIPKKSNAFFQYKVFIAKAYGADAIGEKSSTPVLSAPELGIPGQLCTETFLEIGGFHTQKEAENLIKYIRTKFFRTLVGIQKQTQNMTQKTYSFVPILDFKSNDEINWELSVSKIDEQLYKMFELSDEEIKFIEGKICDIKKIK